MTKLTLHEKSPAFRETYGVMFDVGQVSALDLFENRFKLSECSQTGDMLEDFEKPPVERPRLNIP